MSPVKHGGPTTRGLPATLAEAAPSPPNEIAVSTELLEKIEDAFGCPASDTPTDLAFRGIPIVVPRCEDCHRVITNEEWANYFGRQQALILNGQRVEWHCGCVGERLMQVVPADVRGLG